MDTITATGARSDLFNILKSVIKGHLFTRIKTKEGSAILLSEEDYESIMETAKLMSIPGMTKSIKKADAEIKNGDVYSMDEIFS